MSEEDFYDLIQLPTGEHIYVGRGDNTVIVDGVLYERHADVWMTHTQEAPSRFDDYPSRSHPLGMDI